MCAILVLYEDIYDNIHGFEIYRPYKQENESFGLRYANF